MPRNTANTTSSVVFTRNNALLSVALENKSLADAFGQMNFYSRLLHSLAPNDTGVWVETDRPRVDGYIVGWPREVTWKRISEKNFEANVATSFLPRIDTFIAELNIAINGLKGVKDSPDSLMRATYNFRIRVGEAENEYHFLGRAREVCALCVLYDMQSHPRNHLEVITSEIPLNSWPLGRAPSTPRRIYGDPSKTVDELRNQGFPRVSDIPDADAEPSLVIERSEYDGSHQEHYHLVIREQRREFQVGRSSIPSTIKRALYAAFGNKCNICHQEFTEEYLAPDHRVPAIVEADDLTRTNYREKLQTLCRSCNQVKREMCKKCPFDKSCRQCPWAFPEQHSIGPDIRNQIFEAARNANISPDEFVRRLLRNR